MDEVASSAQKSIFGIREVARDLLHPFSGLPGASRRAYARVRANRIAEASLGSRARRWDIRNRKHDHAAFTFNLIFIISRENPPKK